MSDSTTAIAIVAIITGIGSCIGLILKQIKHSECSNCLKIDTRTPITIAPPPTPILHHHNTTTKNISTNNNNNYTTDITEIEV